MCIAAWIWQSHPSCQFILLLNRDEYHERPTQPMTWWGEGGGEEDILGGRDELGGGTWLGCTRSGRIVLLTNFREPQEPQCPSKAPLLARVWRAGPCSRDPTDRMRSTRIPRRKVGSARIPRRQRGSKTVGSRSARIPKSPGEQQISFPQCPGIKSFKSRGHLPVKFLKSSQNPMEFAEEIAKEADIYNPFNLVVADVCSKTMVFISNRPNGKPIIQTVNPGIHVLSNASLDSPWPKSVLLRSKVVDFLETQADKEISLKEMVGKLMEDKAKADRDMLPITGCDPEWEYSLSSLFVDLDTKWGHYGTRSMSGIAVETENEVSFYERYVEDGAWKEHLVQFVIDK